MATTDVALREAFGRAEPKHVVNNMSIQVATVNGSGSQSSNSVLLRSIFQMGVPVSGKNLFPSNIAGLPTWYTIRANKDGYIARKKEIDFLVAMNPETAQEDVRSLAPGAAVLYDEPLNLSSVRSDLIFYSVPYDKLVAPVCPEAKLRKLVRNMIYVGVVAKLLEIDMGEVEKAIRKQFSKKVKAANLNLAAVQAGYDYATATLPKRDPYFIQRMDKTKGKIIIDGNSAAALGCMFAGVTVVSWYPITPSSSLPEAAIEYMKRFRVGPDGKATFAIVQAEDELAAIGMVIGAGWAGARAMTATAGPGISLMAEFSGLAYYTEVPGVIWDIQRVGPSTGLPTRTSQGDILSTAFCLEPIILVRHGSLAEAATTKKANTANAPTITSATWSASIASSRRRAHSCLGRKSWRTASLRLGSSPMARRTGQSSKAAINYARNATLRPITCGSGRIRSRAKCMIS